MLLLRLLGLQKASAILVLLFFIGGSIQISAGNGAVKFNKNFKLQKKSNVVTVYTVDTSGEKICYNFDDFNADVLLCVYRNINLDVITKTMASKYRIKEIESRRKVKKILNTLELWSIVIAN